MQEMVTTSRRRRAAAANRPDFRRTGAGQTSLPQLTEARQLEGWEDEGGKLMLPFELARILIVDNDIASAGSLELMLHAWSRAQTRVAYSGYAALAIAAEFRPDVVLLEINLFDMSGYEVAQSLRQQARNRCLRLIALTPSREHEDRELARVAYFERYLLKPVSALALSELMRALSPSRSRPPAGRT